LLKGDAVGKILLLTLVLMLGATTAFAQAGTIGIFKDPGGLNCELTTPAGLIPYYVVHVSTSGATACQYSAPKPACFAAMWLSDTSMFPVTIGNSQTGVSIGYGSCRVAPIHVQTINYFATGTTPHCCHYGVLPDPNAVPPGIYMVDCDEHLLNPSGMRSVIHAAPECRCGGTPAEETTWGRVKALYVE
jgi:hypothetical protein